MKVSILMGSPRLQGNKAELVKPFIEELQDMNEYITTEGKK